MPKHSTWSFVAPGASVSFNFTETVPPALRVRLLLNASVPRELALPGAIVPLLVTPPFTVPFPINVWAAPNTKPDSCDTSNVPAVVTLIVAEFAIDAPDDRETVPLLITVLPV